MKTVERISFLFIVFWVSVNVSAETEAEALVRWKTSLIYSPYLNSWVLSNGSNINRRKTSLCNWWIGITCNTDGSVAEINLAGLGLKGTLDRVNLSSFPNLTSLNLNSNFLSGAIPAEIGILSKLMYLDLGNNHFNGSVPLEIGNLSELLDLCLYGNSLRNAIPYELNKLKKVRYLDLGGNHLTSPDLSRFAGMPSLTHLSLYLNSIRGDFPPFMFNCSNLIHLDLSYNQITGNISMPLLTNFRNLKYLDLTSNSFTGTIPTDLVNLTKLEVLRLGRNNFIGLIPSWLRSIPNLKILELHVNQLSGPISPEIGNFSNLEQLNLSNNKITGPIPKEIGKLTQFTIFNLFSNNFTGTFPPEIGNMTSLQMFDVNTNQLQGSLPSLPSNVLYIDMTGNQLSGKIPSEMGNLTQLQELDLSSNYLTGYIPHELGKLSNLAFLDLSHNALSGGIPSSLSNMLSLHSINLSHNALSGGIPSSLSNMSSLHSINLSHNALSGEIPSFLYSNLGPYTIDFSYNNLSGQVPETYPFDHAPDGAFDGNKGLCSKTIGILPPCNSTVDHRNKSHRKFAIAIAVPVSFLLILLIVTISRKCQKKTEIILINETQFTFTDLVKATKNFHGKFFIGKGGFGSVYKAVLPNGLTVAVKRLHSSSEKYGDSFEKKIRDRFEKKIRDSFENEIRALARVRHGNIVKLFPHFRSRRGRMYLVYEYIDKGSLRDVLYEEGENLDWVTRVRIIHGVSLALSYLHHDSSPPIIHGDIAIHNILLDSDYVPRIADFGTAKVLDPDSSSSDSSSYTPERVTKEDDVYSFGVIVLEVMMGKYPYSLIWALSTTSVQHVLIKDVLDQQHVLIKDELDQRLAPPTGQLAEAVEFIVTKGLACVNSNPQARPSMLDVSKAIGSQQGFPF